MTKKQRYTMAAAFFSAATALAVFASFEAQADNEVPLNGTITEESADAFIAAFNDKVLNYEGSEPIVVNINSPGGYNLAGKRIIEAISNSGRDVVLTCDDEASSMAAEILIATPNVRRDMSEDCRILLHAPRLTGINSQGQKETRTIPELQRRLDVLEELEEEYLGSADPIKIAVFNDFRRTIEIELYVLENASQELAETLAAASNLEKEDFLRMFENGDTTILSFRAGIFGFVDTVNGEPVPEHYLEYGPGIICEREPEFSFCGADNETASAQPHIAPEF